MMEKFRMFMGKEGKMKKMKKLLSGLVCLAMVCSMSACGTKKQEEKEPKKDAAAMEDADTSTLEGWGEAIKASQEGTTITALLASHDSTTAMTEMIDEFTELTGINVNTKVLASAEMKTMQRSNSSTKAGTFDVYMVDAFTIYDYAKSGYIDSLEDYLNDSSQTPQWYDHDDILPAYSEGIASVDGVTYTLPIAGEGRFIAYRTDLFEKYEKEIPENLDELLELAQFFNQKEDGLYGFVCRGGAGTLCGSAHMSLAYCFTDDPIIDHKTGEFCVDSPETIQSIEYFLDLVKNGPKDIASYNHEDAAALFMQGQAAMWFDATSMAYMFDDPASCSVAGKIDYFTVPEGPAGGSGAIAGWSLGIPSDSENKDAAYAFIMYMTSKEKAKEYNEKGGIPCRISTFEDKDLLAEKPLNAKVYETIQDAGKLVDRGVSYNYGSAHVLDFMSIIGNQINRAMIGEINAEEATKAAQSEIEAVLAEEK